MEYSIVPGDHVRVCQFCGRPPDIIRSDDDECWEVCCTRHQVSGPLEDSRDMAIAMWNYRPPIGQLA